MASSVPSSPEADTQQTIDQAPSWGAWSAFVVVVCFYLTQAVGISMVQIIVGLNAGLSTGMNGISDVNQVWVLPLSLFLGTIAAAMVSWQVATSRAKPSMDMDWFWQFLGKSYPSRSLLLFVMCGAGLGLGFFVLTEYGVIPPDDLPQPIFEAMRRAPLFLKIGWVVMFIGLFPVVEEVCFRGFLFTGLSQSWGPLLGGMVTTALFIVVHMPKVLEYWPALAAVTLIGGLTVLIRIRTGCLAPSIALHSAYNGTLVVVAFLTASPPAD